MEMKGSQPSVTQKVKATLEGVARPEYSAQRSPCFLKTEDEK